MAGGLAVWEQAKPSLKGLIAKRYELTEVNRGY